MENILILDTETTGLDPDKGCLVVEVGAVLFSVKYRTVLQSVCTLLPIDDNPAKQFNFIDHKWTLEKYNALSAIEMIDTMADHSDYVVAHNAQFDKKFMQTLKCKVNEKEWICTKNNFQWPCILFRKRLEDICKAMDVPYIDAHRALNDCNFIAKCFNKIFDLNDRLEAAVKSHNQNRFR